MTSVYLQQTQGIGLSTLDRIYQVRLVDGNNLDQGRLEVYHNGTWGSVCDDYWSTKDAQVVCREIGLPVAGARASYYGQFEEGVGEIWMDNVTCSGSENNLSECGHAGWGTHNCGHDEDAGVICEGSKLARTLF